MAQVTLSRLRRIHLPDHCPACGRHVLHINHWTGRSAECGCGWGRGVSWVYFRIRYPGVRGDRNSGALQWHS